MVVNLYLKLGLKNFKMDKCVLFHELKRIN